MASNEPKKRSIVATLVANMLTEREDDFTANVTYVASRSIEDLCNIAASGKSKFSASELLAAHNDLKATAKEELYSGSTVEFGLTNNYLGIDGSFIGPKAKFDPAKNNVTLRSTPIKEVKEDMKGISVIVGEVVEGLPTITKLTDVFTGSVNGKITPGNTLNGEGKRVKIAGTEGSPVGFFFVKEGISGTTGQGRITGENTGTLTGNQAYPCIPGTWTNEGADQTDRALWGGDSYPFPATRAITVWDMTTDPTLLPRLQAFIDKGTQQPADNLPKIAYQTFKVTLSQPTTGGTISVTYTLMETPTFQLTPF
ncbi:DNA-binding domain-containing protein [Parabacteroides gordonii]|jgi:hypothetical protein|uniref:DNA-binding domain-containing protein n=1 Tax=Parabacteroides gordonii TaxID=574930 RepID=UPI00241CAA78|nr:DNA-binding domain-containing protein [Parabacteroides gordonii]